MDEQQRPGAVQVVHSTLIQHRAGSVGRESLVHLIPVLTPECLLPSQWVPGLALSPRYFPHGSNRCSHCTNVNGTKPRAIILLWLLHKTYSICDAPLSRSTRSRESPLLRHRNHAATTVLNLRVNRSPIPYDFRGSAKAIGYSVTVWPPK